MDLSYIYKKYFYCSFYLNVYKLISIIIKKFCVLKNSLNYKIIINIWNH